MTIAIDNPIAIPVTFLCIAGLIRGFMRLSSEELRLRRPLRARATETSLCRLSKVEWAEITPSELTLHFRICTPVYWGVAVLALSFAAYGVETRDATIFFIGAGVFLLAAAILQQVRKYVRLVKHAGGINAETLVSAFGFALRRKSLTGSAMHFELRKVLGDGAGTGRALDAVSEKGRLELLETSPWWQPIRSPSFQRLVAKALNNWSSVTQTSSE